MQSKEVEMPSQEYRDRRKEVLFKEQNGLCFYCKQPMLLIKWNSNSKESKGKPTPPNLCTIEHLFDRNDPIARKRRPNGEKRWVAACCKCNFEKGAAREASVPIEELRLRSSKHRRWGRGGKHKKWSANETA